MDAGLLKDIVDWDVVNWSKAIKYWEKNFDLRNKNFKCLELGGRKGGLSLLMALQGNEVICSDLESPEKDAAAIHKKHGCQALIQYRAIDATNIPYENYFDVIAFKSILGGISRKNENSLKKKTIDQIHKALKEKGVLLFAENIEASALHRVLRKKFVSWGSEWNYLKINEIENVFSSFASVSYVTVGFFGAFGRNEKQRNALGRLDGVFEKLVPKNKRYIVIGIARK